MRLLVAKNANLDFQTKAQLLTPLHLVIAALQREPRRAREIEPLAILLVRNGASMTIPDDQGDTGESSACRA